MGAIAVDAIGEIDAMVTTGTIASTRMAERFLIVDGHSIIFAWPELRELHDRKTALARERLVKTLTEYQDYSGVRVVLVFDGRGQSVSEVTEPGGIQIFYSNIGRTADQIV